MRSLILSLVLGAASLGLVVGTPSSAKAQFRRSFAYYPTYSYGYPAYSYGYGYPSYGYGGYYRPYYGGYYGAYARAPVARRAAVHRVRSR